jgi:hypothetical protein
MDVRLRLLKTIYQPMADVGLKPDDLAQLYAHSEVRHFKKKQHQVGMRTISSLTAEQTQMKFLQPRWPQRG